MIYVHFHRCSSSIPKKKIQVYTGLILGNPDNRRVLRMCGRVGRYLAGISLSKNEWIERRDLSLDALTPIQWATLVLHVSRKKYRLQAFIDFLTCLLSMFWRFGPDFFSLGFVMWSPKQWSCQDLFTAVVAKDYGIWRPPPPTFRVQMVWEGDGHPGFTQGKWLVMVAIDHIMYIYIYTYVLDIYSIHCIYTD